jgi:hypothetical protein
VSCSLPLHCLVGAENIFEKKSVPGFVPKEFVFEFEKIIYKTVRIKHCLIPLLQASIFNVCACLCHTLSCDLEIDSNYM